MAKLTDDLRSKATALPKGDPLRVLLVRAADEIDGLREHLDALRVAFATVDKAVRSPGTINALSRRNP